VIKKIKKYYIIILSLTLAVGIIFVIIKQRNHSSFFFTSFGVSLPNNNSTLGIDISHHQGKINWDEVEDMKINGDSIQFVYMKVTEGANFKDKQYNRNRKILNSKPVKVGVYHFFSPSLNVIKQVSHFTNSFQKKSLKPVLDVEKIGDLSKIEIVNAVDLFLNETEKRIHVRPVIYTYESFYNDYFKGTKIENELFWIANYNGACDICDQDNVLLWQFSDNGTINGINEKVDLNEAKSNFWGNIIWL
jgi:lysozyme